MCPRIGEIVQVGNHDYLVKNITWIVRDVRYITPWPMLFLTYPGDKELWEQLAAIKPDKSCICSLCGQGLDD
jgi:hypothetical protein